MEEMIADAYVDSIIHWLHAKLTPYVEKRRTKKQWNGNTNSFVGVGTEHQSLPHRRRKRRKYTGLLQVRKHR